MTRVRERTFLIAVAITPVVMAVVMVQAAEPFPRDWLHTDNPHFWANMLRAVTFFLGGLIIGLITYTMVMSISRETTVSGGHPRRKLYRHVTLIAAGHGMLMVSVLFYIRERVNFGLSPATPCVILGLVATIAALQQMISYQNSRLRTFHAAKQIIGVIQPSEEDERDLVITPVGSTEPVALREWIGGFEGGVLARMTIEKVEEVGQPRKRRGSR